MSKLGNNLRQNTELVLRPRLTEKATLASTTSTSGPVYTFEVRPQTNKTQVKAAIKELYKVVPVKINMIKLPAKYKINRGRWGQNTPTYKALVYLKAGDKIE